MQIFNIKNLFWLVFFFLSMYFINMYSIEYLKIDPIGSWEILVLGILIIYFIKRKKG
jgi:uncharacterized membrane protein